MELEQRQLLGLGGALDLTQRGVDEHAGHLAATLEPSPDLGRDVGVDAARALRVMVQPDRPGTELLGGLRVLDVGDSADLDPHPSRVADACLAEGSRRAAGRPFPRTG